MTKTQLTNLIKEEAQKIKKEFALQDRKAAILKEIKETYGDMGEGEIDELFGMGGSLFKQQSPEDNRKKFSDALVKVAKGRQEEYQKKSGKVMPMPKWANVGTPEHEKAIDAAVQLKTADIYWNQAKGQFLPKTYSATGHTFGGGGDGVTLEESKKEPVKTTEKKVEEKKK